MFSSIHDKVKLKMSLMNDKNINFQEPSVVQKQKLL